MTAYPWTIDPALDLVLERTVDVSTDLVWKAWTEPEHIKKWFTPAPWQTADCEIDLRPGGAFKTVMRSPDGDEHPVVGCYLEVVPEERLVWTTALLPGFRPVPAASGSEESSAPRFTAFVLLAPAVEGTRYTAIAVHADQGAREAHDRMGFRAGWGRALDQLVAHMKGH